MVIKKKKEIKKENIWTPECEALLAEWSEKASCYRWLHGRCEKSYKKWYYCFSIPVIILSTLTGAANVGMDLSPHGAGRHESAIGGGRCLQLLLSLLVLHQAAHLQARG